MANVPPEIRVKTVLLDLDLMSEVAHGMAACFTKVGAAFSELGFRLDEVKETAEERKRYQERQNAGG